MYFKTNALALPQTMTHTVEIVSEKPKLMADLSLCDFSAKKRSFRFPFYSLFTDVTTKLQLKRHDQTIKSTKMLNTFIPILL